MTDDEMSAQLQGFYEAIKAEHPELSHAQIMQLAGRQLLDQDLQRLAQANPGEQEKAHQVLQGCIANIDRQLRAVALFLKIEQAEATA